MRDAAQRNVSSPAMFDGAPTVASSIVSVPSGKMGATPCQGYDSKRQLAVLPSTRPAASAVNLTEKPPRVLQTDGSPGAALGQHLFIRTAVATAHSSMKSSKPIGALKVGVKAPTSIIGFAPRLRFLAARASPAQAGAGSHDANG